MICLICAETQTDDGERLEVFADEGESKKAAKEKAATKMALSGHCSEAAASKAESGPEGSIDVSILKELARKGLVDALNSVNGAKTLVLDPTLAGPLGLVTEVALLKHHGVDKMFWLEPGPLSATSANIVYLCRPLIKWIKIIADQIKRHARESQKHTYTLLLVPRTSTLVTRILEEEGVLGDVTISSYNLQFIPLAEDVISLERESAFKEIWVDGDETVIYDSMQALTTIEKLHGLFPRIVGKGDYAARLAKLLTRNTSSTPSSSSAQDTHLGSPSETIDSLIILDRRVDMISPLLTQLTYEGLIDELIGIKNSHVELPASLMSPPTASNQAEAAASSTAASLMKEKKRKYHLTTATDPLLSDLQDLNFSAVGKKLNQVARRLEEDYKLRHQMDTVPKLREFVGKLGGLQSEHQSLRLHTGLSEMLVPMTRTEEFNKSLEIQQNLLALYDVNAQITAIEDLIAQGADMRTVLRLLCLASIVLGGVKAKSLENLKREILQVPDLKYPYNNLRKSLRLLIEDPDPLEELENDISYVYSGFAPISVRLVQCVAQKGGVLSNPATEKDKKGAGGEDGSKKPASGPMVQAHPIVGWKGFEDVVASIPGETVDIVQRLPGAQDGSVLPPVSSLMLPRDRTTTTVVFFLGGVTYTEIAALRWVSRQNKGRKFLIATTGIISGNSLIDSIAGIGGTTAKEAGL
ncbi:Sec1-like protein [Trametes sanguinea]|nr:Sec1-like protein [Trametes sanguinea]